MLLWSADKGEVHRDLSVGEHELVIANTKEVPFIDLLTEGLLTVELDSVGRAHIDDKISFGVFFDDGVLSGDVGIFQEQIAPLLAAANDKTLFIDCDFFPFVNHA